MATNRFSAEQGRSAASAVNVVTRSGIGHARGLRHVPPPRRLAAGPARDLRPLVRRGAALLPPAVLGDARAARSCAARPGGSRAAEYRNQDAVVQVGERDPATRTIRRDLAAAPLDDLLGLGRVDVTASDADTLGLRYVLQDQEDVAASTLDRAIGSASQRQTGRNRHHQGLVTWTRTLGATAVNTLRLSYSDYRNAIDPVAPGRQLTFPSIQDGASFRVPQGTTQTRWQLSESVSWVKGAHSLRFGGEVSRTYGRFDLGVFRDGRVEMVQDFPEFDLNRDGRVDDDDLLFAVTLRSGKPDQDLVLDDCSSTYLAAFVQDDWRVTPQLTLNVGLRCEMDTNVKNISGYRDTNPHRAAFSAGRPRRATSTTSDPAWASPGRTARAPCRSTAGGVSTTTA